MLIYNSILEVLSVLGKIDRVRALYRALLLGLASVLELFGLGVLVPVIQVAINKDFLDPNSYLNFFFLKSDLENPDHFIFLVLGGILIFTLLKNLVLVWLNKMVVDFVYDLKSIFSSQTLSYYYSKGYLFFKENESHELLNDVQNHSTFYTQGVILPLFRLLNEILIISFILVALLLFNWKAVSILLLLVLPVVLGSYYLIRGKMNEVIGAINSLIPKMQSTIYQSIYGYLDVKITNTESKFKSQFESQLLKYRKLMTEKEIYNFIPQRLIETVMIASVIVLLFLAVFVGERGQDLTIILGIFVLAAYRLGPSINRIMLSVLSIRSHRFSYKIIKLSSNYLNVKPGKSSNIKFSKKLIIKNLCFSYSERPDVILNLNMEIQKGETIGIVGESGSGKSTFVQILLRFLEENSGSIDVDGITINNSNTSSWRNIIGYVPQNIFVFNGSIAENVAFGQKKEEIDFERIEHSLKMANLVHFVNELPDGVNSAVGEDGGNLSGGQRQRLAIARALYSGAEILVLDEATSALDYQTEKEITNTISSLANGELTIILIAHRYSTLESCNVIYEFKNGCVSSALNHGQLMQKMEKSSLSKS